jgi:hypothetical protein
MDGRLKGNETDGRFKGRKVPQSNPPIMTVVQQIIKRN